MKKSILMGVVAIGWLSAFAETYVGISDVVVMPSADTSRSPITLAYSPLGL